VDLSRVRASSHPDRTAFSYLRDGVADRIDLTFAGLDARARAVAAELQGLGAAGERALLFFPQGLDFVEAFFGCLYAGAVAVPAYPPRSNRSLARLAAIAADSGARFALTTESVLERSLRAGRGLEGFRRLRWIAADRVAGGAGAAWRPPEAGPGSPAFLQYTSGSTGTPRGVAVTHGNLLHNEAALFDRFGHGEETRIVSWLPLFHDMGLIVNVLQAVYAGVPCVLMAPAHFVQSPALWLRAISTHRATTSGGPDFAYRLCADRVTDEQARGLDLSCWRLAFNGAEPVRAETLERFAARFGPYGFRREAFYPAYGLAEGTVFVAGGRAGAPPEVAPFDAAALEAGLAVPPREGRAARRLVACGWSLDDQEIVIADPDTGGPAAAGAVGEIWISGPSVASGYWGRPEETDRTFRARLAGAGPGARTYLRTGDLGCLRDGRLFVTGRLKDLIIVRGRNLHPHDLEDAAGRSLPAVRAGASAAFAVDDGGEERIVLVAEVGPGARRASGGEIAAAVRRAVAEEHEVSVHEVVLVRRGTIPRTTSGKIQRGACRAAYLEGRLDRAAFPAPAARDGGGLGPAGAPAAPRTPAEAALASIWASLLRRPEVGVHDDFFALGGDSVLAVQVAARAREAGLPVTPRQVFLHPTIAELAAAAAAAAAAGGDPAAAARAAEDEGPAPETFHDAELTREQLHRVLEEIARAAERATP
jgi:acyl-CoA synthetase (AMP-forming)/AMP-acid ligase II/aryl carrier-like protein